MKKRLNKTLADIEKTIEFTSLLPEETMLKVNVKSELIKKLEVIVKNLNDLDDFLEMLEEYEEKQHSKWNTDFADQTD